MPDIIRLLSQTPLGPSDGFPLVVVCAAESVFCQVTVPPTGTIAEYGRKQELVSSHPGTDVPDPIKIVDVETDSISTAGSGASTTHIPSCITVPGPHDGSARTKVNSLQLWNDPCCAII